MSRAFATASGNVFEVLALVPAGVARAMSIVPAACVGETAVIEPS